MKKYYYDLHLHSCLSPCGDNEMTPNNIVGMAIVAGLDIVALTDHNSCRNCPAFCKIAKANGIIPLPGMELTTAEDIHVICLFKNSDDALKFDEYVKGRLIKIKNRTDIFGDQLVMNEDDEIIDNEEYLLINATDITIDEVKNLVESFNGLCYPAHIDKEANGVIATLGIFPDYIGFACVELNNSEKASEYKEKFPYISDKPIVISSDAHYLWDINGKENYFEFDETGDTLEQLFERLGGI